MIKEEDTLLNVLGLKESNQGFNSLTDVSNCLLVFYQNRIKGETLRDMENRTGYTKSSLQQQSVNGHIAFNQLYMLLRIIGADFYLLWNSDITTTKRKTIFPTFVRDIDWKLLEKYYPITKILKQI